VIRVGVSLPYIVLYALAPRESAMGGALLALGLAGVGAWALMRMRTWGILAIAGAAVATAVSLADTAQFAPMGGGVGLDLVALGLGATVLLAAAAAPFLAPAARFVRGK
jgi:hypothetical protein